MMTIYYRTGEIGEPDAYERVGAVSLDAAGALSLDGDARLHQIIDVLHSTSIGAQMTPQEFIRTLPGRINPYMGYAIEEA